MYKIKNVQNKKCIKNVQNKKCIIYEIIGLFCLIIILSGS